MTKKKNVKAYKSRGGKPQKREPILWALDPFSDLAKESGPIHHFIERHFAMDHTPIELVYVLSPDGLNWTGTFSGPWVNRLKPYVEQAYAKLPFKADFKILPSPKVSLRSDVKKLCDYAKKEKAQILVLQTHGRRGVERFFLGSFAETVLLTSKVPVLLFNPEAELPKAVHRILLPVDLSPGSKAAAKKLIPYAKKLGAEVMIYHKMPDPIEPIVQSGVYMAGGGWINLEQFRTKDFGKRSKSCEDLVDLFKKSGVKAQAHVDDQPGLIAERIRQSCEKNSCGMVAVLSQSGPIETLLMGSITRDLARELRHPLFVLPGR